MLSKAKARILVWVDITKRALPKTRKQWYYFTIGTFWMVLAGVGVAIPAFMPSIPFVLLAAPYFAKSSPLIYEILKKHKDFGPTLDHLENNGSIWSIPIPKKAKKRAIIMIIAGYCLSVSGYFFFSFANVPVLVTVACILGGVSAFILTRPSEHIPAK